MTTFTAVQIIAPATLTTGILTYYTAPTETQTLIRRITFCNVTATAATFTVHLVPSGGSADTTNLLINAERLGPTKTVAPPELEGMVLETGDTIQMKAGTGSAITVAGAGTEIA